MLQRGRWSPGRARVSPGRDQVTFEFAAAYRHYHAAAMTVIATGGASGTSSFYQTKTGWTAGGGVEWSPQSFPTWSAKVEYLYTDLGREVVLNSGLANGFEGPAGDYVRRANLPRGGSLDERVRRLAALPLNFQPGTQWEYSQSTDVLGRVIEVVSGKSLFAFMKERILDPIGMKDTEFYVADKAKFPRHTAEMHCGNCALYQGGAEYAAIRQAKETLGQKQLDLSVARDQARVGIAQAWAQLEASKSSIQSSASQVKSAEAALNGVREEARVGQRTTLDVLNAQQELLTARVSLIAAQRDRVVGSYQVVQTVGRLNPLRLLGKAAPTA